MDSLNLKFASSFFWNAKLRLEVYLGRNQNEEKNLVPNHWATRARAPTTSQESAAAFGKKSSGLCKTTCARGNSKFKFDFDFWFSYGKPENPVTFILLWDHYVWSSHTYTRPCCNLGRTLFTSFTFCSISSSCYMILKEYMLLHLSVFHYRDISYDYTNFCLGSAREFPSDSRPKTRWEVASPECRDWARTGNILFLNARDATFPRKWYSGTQTLS